MRRIICLSFFLLMASACSKKDNTPPSDAYLQFYSVANIQNAVVEDAKCGIDLSNGVLYTVQEGYQHQSNIDIAYGYMQYGSDPRYERCFLAISYAGCWCGGSSFFSYGDYNGTMTGYSSYVIRNNIKLKMAPGAVDFNAAKFFTTKEQFDAIFPEVDDSFSDGAFFASKDNLAPNPYVFFQTKKGKRGIIHIKDYTKKTDADYQLQNNPISIEILVEK